MSAYQKFFDQLNEKQASGSAIKTATWLIKIAQAQTSKTGEGNATKNHITSSHVEGFKDFSDLQEFRYGMNRDVQLNATESAKPEGGLEGGFLNVVTTASSLNADLNNLFHKNECLAVDIARIQTLNKNKPTLLELYEFKSCYITNLICTGGSSSKAETGDVLAVSFRYSSFTRSVAKISDTGAAEGHTSSSYSFVKNTNQTK